MSSTALSDLEINAAVARRIFGTKRVHVESYTVYVYHGHAKRFKWETHAIDYKAAYFAEMYEPCQSAMAQLIERNQAEDDFVAALIRLTGRRGRWDLMRATPRQWCEAFLEIAPEPEVRSYPTRQEAEDAWAARRGHEPEAAPERAPGEVG